MGGTHGFLELGGNLHGGAELVAEADFFDVGVAFDHGEFLAERDEGMIAGIERGAQQGGEAADDLLGAGGIGCDERADGVEGVEEEVRMNP
jgi:hypothetical protein